jgi:hypothetical protein
MKEPKLGPTQFAADVERLKAEGKFPSLETLLAAIAETRREFVPKILAVRAKPKSPTLTGEVQSVSRALRPMREPEL